eukprot:TRINITY_DN1833_c0_g6_i1.p2 TRINITY_DN1833_c0_g6~~TRINITY_DN1833_c0_g6_i1.p2  ORF type:complete len:233 (+),score=100.47 TRINITY_DN1833_c0_g6_i1:106-804(+)
MSEEHSLKFWSDVWAEGQTGWRAFENLPEGPPFAGNVRFVEAAMGNSVLCEGKTAFVPLCGDSPVVVYLAEQGMEVVGLEYAPLGVEQLKARVAAVPEDVQKRIHVVQCDFFGFLPGSELHQNSTASHIKHFDFVYDRASFVAIDPARRSEYISLMEAWTNPGALYFYEGIQRKPSVVQEGPPHHTPSDSFGKTLFAGWTAKLDDPTGPPAEDADLPFPFSFFRAALKRNPK